MMCKMAHPIQTFLGQQPHFFERCHMPMSRNWGGHMLDSPQLGPSLLVHWRTGINMQTMRYCAVVVPEELIEVIDNKDPQQVEYVAPCLHILCLSMRPLLKQYVNNKILKMGKMAHPIQTLLGHQPHQTIRSVSDEVDLLALCSDGVRNTDLCHSCW